MILNSSSERVLGMSKNQSIRAKILQWKPILYTRLTLVMMISLHVKAAKRLYSQPIICGDYTRCLSTNL